jgi:hypothetical protein
MSTIRVKVAGPDAITLFKGMAKFAGTRVREIDYVGWESLKGARHGKAVPSQAEGIVATPGPTQPYCFLVVDLDTFVSHLTKLSEK